MDAIVVTAGPSRELESMHSLGNVNSHGWANERQGTPQVPVYIPDKSVLTAREIEDLRLLGDGLSTKDVASQLQVAFKTAACHRYRILQKLGVSSTISAVRVAIREGIIEP